MAAVSWSNGANLLWAILANKGKVGNSTTINQTSINDVDNNGTVSASELYTQLKENGIAFDAISLSPQALNGIPDLSEENKSETAVQEVDLVDGTDNDEVSATSTEAPAATATDTPAAEEPAAGAPETTPMPAPSPTTAPAAGNTNTGVFANGNITRSQLDTSFPGWESMFTPEQVTAIRSEFQNNNFSVPLTRFRELGGAKADIILYRTAFGSDGTITKENFSALVNAGLIDQSRLGGKTADQYHDQVLGNAGKTYLGVLRSGILPPNTELSFKIAGMMSGKIDGQHRTLTVSGGAGAAGATFNIYTWTNPATNKIEGIVSQVNPQTGSTENFRQFEAATEEEVNNQIKEKISDLTNGDIQLKGGMFGTAYKEQRFDENGRSVSISKSSALKFAEMQQDIQKWMPLINAAQSIAQLIRAFNPLASAWPQMTGPLSMGTGNITGG